MIEAVVVDLAGVAARFRPERRLAALAELSGIPRGLIQSRIFDSGFEETTERGRFSPHWTEEGMLWALNLRISADVLTEAWSKAFEPDSDVLGAIAALPIRRVMLTNNGPMINACLSGPLRVFRGYFDDIICSWQIEAVKPEPAAFMRAAQRIGLPPGSLLLLDDGAANVSAAIECGWHAEKVSGHEDLVAALTKYPELQPA